MTVVAFPTMLRCAALFSTPIFACLSALHQYDIYQYDIYRVNLGPFLFQRRVFKNIPSTCSEQSERANSYTRECRFENRVENENEKMYNKVVALKDILINEPQQVISLGDLGMLRRKVGLKEDRQFAKVIRGYPALFEVYEDQDRLLWCGFSEQAEEVVGQEMEIQKAYEHVAVQKLRKLLMMAVNKRLHVSKIAHLRRDIGLPIDFRRRMVYDYPQFFRVAVETDGPVLELMAWDSSLGVTALEREAASGGFPRELKFKISTPSGATLSAMQRTNLEKLQALPFISPYGDVANSTMSKIELEKRSVVLVHEMLSMMHEKRALYEYFTHFHEEYNLPHSVLDVCLRHQHIFSVSRNKHHFRVALKQAYDGMNLIDKNEWVFLKERYIGLMSLDKSIKSIKKVVDKPN